MSDKQGAKIKSPHPQVLEDIGPIAADALLKIADALETGIIPPELYDQSNYHSYDPDCGTARCIWSLVVSREPQLALLPWPNGLRHLCDGRQPSNPELAVPAIRRYVYLNAEHPWSS